MRGVIGLPRARHGTITDPGYSSPRKKVAEGWLVVALALMGIAATTMADFDLSAMPSTVSAERPFAIDIVQSQDRSPYLPPQLHEQTGSGEAGVRVKLRWRRVKLYVPFGPS